MGAEEQINKQFETYQKLAQEHKGVDVASLMINALTQARREEMDQRKKSRAYLVSVLAPPLGLFYAASYALRDQPGGKRVALICVILTVVTLTLAWAVGSLIFAGAGPNTASQIQDIQNINVGALRGLLQQ